MPLSITLFPDIDGLDDLIEHTMPWLALCLVLLAGALAAVVVARLVSRIRHRSPVDKLLRRRFG